MSTKTIEQKAKAYDEMLQRVKELHESGNTFTKAQMEVICPELAYSEDERIRKSIIYILQVGGYMSPEEKDKAFAYLEKQKDITSVASIQEAYRKGFNNAIEAVKQKPEKYGLQKEQKQKMEEQQ